MYVHHAVMQYHFTQVLKQRPNLWAFVVQSEADEEEHFADVGAESSGGDRRGSQQSGYQIAGRNPLYCKAETSCLWELARLQSHYHPSVHAFAKKIAQVYIHPWFVRLSHPVGTK